MKKLILFGAGRIGRSFIGQLFSRGGYEVVFIDIDRDLINSLNNSAFYRVFITSDEGEKVQEIRNIRGIHLNEKQNIISEMKDGHLIGTAVGAMNLLPVIDIIGEGIRNRIDHDILSPMDIIIAENLRNAGSYFKNALKPWLSDLEIEKYVGLIETSIGKMVPLPSPAQRQDNSLDVYAEPYNTLILDEFGFKNKIPGIKGIDPKKNMKAWVDRKSFIHNLGHAATAYYGFYRYPERVHLYEVLNDPEVHQFVRATMLQAGSALVKIYPNEFSPDDIIKHTDDLISRFRNKALGDTIFRVGRDLARKLGPEDRIIGALKMALKANGEHDLIDKTLVYALHFKAMDERGNYYQQDKWFLEQLHARGIDWVFTDICKLDMKTDKGIIENLKKFYNYLKSPTF